MIKIFHPVPAAVILMQVAAASAVQAAETRASGLGVCTVYETAGVVEFELQNCRIVSHATDSWTKFMAEGFEAEFEGDAMEDDVILQNGETYARTDDLSKWCYSATLSEYAICFAPNEI